MKSIVRLNKYGEAENDYLTPAEPINIT